MSIAILTPLRGHAKYIIPMLRSVQAQTFEDWECHVVIDGVDLVARDFVEVICEQDSRVTYTMSNDQIGVAAARNMAVHHTRAPWLLPFDADDMMKPAYLSVLLNAAYSALHNPDTKEPVLYTAATCIRADGSEYDFVYPDFDPVSFTSKFQIPNTSLHPRSLHTALGGWDAAWTNGAEDWHYWTRAVAADLITPLNVKSAHWYYREHDGARNSRIGARHWLTHKATLDEILATRFK